MQTYTCNYCGYCYDPAKGDPRIGLAPGLDFCRLPEDWCCPECGASRRLFVSAEDMRRLDEECRSGGCEPSCDIPCF
ncbi:MAG: rubredoxin [Thermodesulfobacteriota bacterium]